MDGSSLRLHRPHSLHAKELKPQSVLAMIRSLSPTAATASHRRLATTCGCSTKFVAVSSTPGLSSMCAGNGCSLSASYSCRWRRLANSIDKAPTFALKSAGKIVAMAMSSMYGTIVIAPANMQTDTVAWDAGKTLIDRRDMPLELLQERPLIEMRKEAGALHRQVGCIDLQHMPRFVDRPVLVGERLRQCRQIGVVTGVVLVGHGRGNDARRRHGHECLAKTRAKLL